MGSTTLHNSFLNPAHVYMQVSNLSLAISLSLYLYLRFKKRVLIQQLESALEEIEERQMLTAQVNNVHGR